MNGYQDKITTNDKKKMEENKNQSGFKDDAGKLLYHLIPTESTKGLAEILTHGANKYTPDGWKDVPKAKERYTGALMRHFEAYRSGEKLDPESGLPHIYHVLTNAAFLGYFDEHNLNP